MRRPLPRASVPLALVLLVSSLAAHADGGIEGGILAGLTRFERALTGDEPSFEPTVGLRVGYVFSRHLGCYLDAVYATTDTVTNGEAAVVEGRAGLDYIFQPGRGARWFAGGGIGVMSIGFDARDDLRNFMYSAGAGQRIRIGRGMHIRWEFRVDVSASRGDFHKTVNDGKILVGLIWGRADKTDP